MESERGQKHRDMNERLSLYLTMSPHEVLPSAKKNYPSPIVLPVDRQECNRTATKEMEEEYQVLDGNFQELRDLLILW
ncbi:hypothetical protein D0866_03688 [Hortaea werneckii]|uniref:Uncharacterized protein n=1 Tax=Hortaea werneckii TaxID=91943 RepID=A0A3M7BAW9_HORWE|nr:hypothetical protein D0866_03688 [Hortaea werneckii]